MVRKEKKNLLWKRFNFVFQSNNTLTEICWTNMTRQSAECISVLLQMGNTAVSNSIELFHQTFPSPVLFSQDNLWKGVYKAKEVCSLLLKSSCVTEGHPNWDPHWGPTCLPGPALLSSRHTPACAGQGDMERGKGAELCTDLSQQHVSDGSQVSEAFQRVIKKKASYKHRYRQTELEIVRLGVS